MAKTHGCTMSEGKVRKKILERLLSNSISLKLPADSYIEGSQKWYATRALP